MLIRPDSISAKKEFVANGTIPVETVDKYFEDICGCHALTPLTYRATLLNGPKGITLKAHIVATLEFLCSRCGRDFSRNYDLDVHLKLIDENRLANLEEIALSDEDLDSVTFQNQIDLDHILLESIYLEIDDELCQPDCKGICTQCGANLNLGNCHCQNIDLS